MKIVLLISALLLSLHAGHIEDFAKKFHYETNYQEALSKAKAQNKPIMMVLVTHYCPWCRKFEAKTLSRQSIDQSINQRFIKLVLNRDKKAYPRAFSTPLVPTTYFINPKNQTIIKKIFGYKGKKDFKALIEKVPSL